MYIHELNYKQTLDHQKKLLKEAQNHRFAKHQNLRKKVAQFLFDVAEKLESKPAQSGNNLLRS